MNGMLRENRFLMIGAGLVLVCIMTGCATTEPANQPAPVWQRIEAIVSTPRERDTVAPSLKAFLAAKKNLKVVLRVPTWREDSKGKQSEPTAAYNLIEEELLGAGFTVRDRGLLAQVLRTHPTLDFQAIAKKVDTDLILEIVKIETVELKTSKYRLLTDNSIHTFDRPSGHYQMRFRGIEFEAKVIRVEAGEVGAFFKFFGGPDDLTYEIRNPLRSDGGTTTEYWRYYDDEWKQNTYVFRGFPWGDGWDSSNIPSTKEYLLCLPWRGVRTEKEEEDLYLEFAKKLIAKLRGLEFKPAPKPRRTVPHRMRPNAMGRPKVNVPGPSR